MDNQAQLITFLIITAVVIVIAANIISSKANAKKLKGRIAQMWGKEPDVKYKNEELTSIASYFRNKCGVLKDTHFIDDITWQDIDMDSVFKRFNSTWSTPGEEYLYALLREPLFDGNMLRERERVISLFQNSNEQRLKLQFILAGLGKKRFVDITDYFFDKERKGAGKALYYRLLSIIAVIAPVLAVLKVEIGLPILLASFIMNITVYNKAKNEMGGQLEALSYIISLVGCSKKITDLGLPELKTYNNTLKDCYKNLKSINKISFNIFYSSSNEILEYVKILLLKELIDYEVLCSAIRKHGEDLLHLYETVGLLDSLLSIASYRDSVQYYSVPVLRRLGTEDQKYLRCKDIYHPLIKNPVTNSVELSRSVLITGSNASGKSTFLKTCAINAVMAQTINTCLAREYGSGYFKIYSSMALKDSLFNNESYYIAEIKSLKRILDQLNENVPCLCFIDEVLRGTNTVERIAASSQVLHYLGGNNCLCIAATHDIELTAILRQSFDNYHFEEQITDNDITFDYKIYDGKSKTRNAIKLLKLMGYQDTLVRQADDRAHSFTEEGIWKEINVS